MASVWFSVIVLIFTQQVFANQDIRHHQTCDQCIRDGSLWCSDPKEEHCVSMSNHGERWCQSTRAEVLKSIPEVNHPNYIERTIYIDIPDYLNINDPTKQYSITQEVQFKVINSTQNTNYIDVTDNINKIKVTVDIGFCMRNGTNMEYFYVELFDSNTNITKTVKYHVPCACDCSSKNISKNSFWCHGHGDFACGVCICHEHWTGTFCNEVAENTPCSNRGDIPNPTVELLCNGNGNNTGPCESCVCYENVEGEQYFNQEVQCRDICQLTSDCEGCIKNATLGRCVEDCHLHITIQPLNKSLLAERDIFDRKIWVNCKLNDGDINYMAMSPDNDKIFVMVEPGTPHAAALESEMAVAFGIVVLILLVAAVAGMMMWKHLRTVPPLPSTDMQYHNIDAEDCTGVNPLYIDPCSSFKNPMYGK